MMSHVQVGCVYFQGTVQMVGFLVNTTSNMLKLFSADSLA